jgi:hypothetical protein
LDSRSALAVAVDAVSTARRIVFPKATPRRASARQPFQKQPAAEK